MALNPEEPMLLWTLRGQGKVVRCLRQRTRDGHELRVLWGEDVFLSETFRNQDRVAARAAEFKRTLEARGWEAVPDAALAGVPGGGREPVAPAASIPPPGPSPPGVPPAVHLETERAGVAVPAGRPIVLVVDDEAAVRTFLRSYLGAAGYAVREAEDVDTALAALDEGDVDAVVLDVRMPDRMGWGRTGLEVLAFIRLHVAWADLPVLLLTGYPLAADELALVARHRASLFLKPEGHRQLLDRLNEVTGRTKGGHLAE